MLRTETGNTLLERGFSIVDQQGLSSPYVRPAATGLKIDTEVK